MTCSSTTVLHAPPYSPHTSSDAEPQAVPFLNGRWVGTTAVVVFCSRPVQSDSGMLRVPLVIVSPIASVTDTVRYARAPTVQASLTGANTTAPLASSLACLPSLTAATPGGSDWQ